jgi:hypothetical protein
MILKEGGAATGYKEAKNALKQAKDEGKSIDVEKHDVYVDENLLGTKKRDWLKP